VRPVHIAVTNGNTLIAYATVVWKTLELNGEIYSCGGLANVMTFPHFRKQGYGRQIVKAATKIIQEAANVDIGMLWTAAQNAGFYAHAGWEALPEMVTLMGDTNNPQVYDDEGAMMLFLSAKGKRGRAAFEHGRVYVGEWTW
jgi:GNAT superfamily N-acetyltransferase